MLTSCVEKKNSLLDLLKAIYYIFAPVYILVGSSIINFLLSALDAIVVPPTYPTPVPPSPAPACPEDYPAPAAAAA